MKHATPTPRAALLLMLAATPLLAACAGVPETESEGAAESPEPVGEATFALTVGEAINSGCSTSSVKGLSQQIIEQGQCIEPAAFVELPAQPNLSLGAAVFPFLEAPAKDALVAALKSKSGTSMTINSMLRTVAQQYLLYQWYLDGSCGISLAATPGNSNHETGLALDVSQYATWQSALEANGFKWLGANDVVHFDYVGPGAKSYKGLDVLAFQMLWNKNHPNDLIDEDGVYGPQTGSRLAQSPAGGFAVGADCNAPKPNPDVYLKITLVEGEDRFADASSAGVNDVYEGETYAVQMEITNKGGAAASDVEVGVTLGEPFVSASDYLIESDWMNGGAFEENDANTSPSNPKHKEPLAAAFSLAMNALSPGETKRVTLFLAADAYSIVPGEPPSARVWIKDIPGYYHQDDFNGASDNVNGSQTFGEKLQVFLPLDIYSRTQWEWDTDRSEGFSPSGSATLALDPAAMVMLVGGQGDDPGALGPKTSFSAASRTAIMLRAKRTGGEGSAKVYFATDSEPGMSEEKSLSFDLPDDDVFHDITIVASANPLWTGTITALRVDPFEKGPGSAELDYLRVISADVGEDGSGGSAGAGAGADTSGDGAGCSCQVPGGATSGSEKGSRGVVSLLTGIAAACVVDARRRRRRGVLSKR